VTSSVGVFIDGEQSPARAGRPAGRAEPSLNGPGRA